MDVSKINFEIVAIVDAASAAFFDCTDERRQVEIVSRAKRQIDKINKDFKRAIDSRAEGRPGAKRFSINQRESLEVLLQKYHYENLCKLDGLLQSLDHGDS
jgi:hypothetical protein